MALAPQLSSAINLALGQDSTPQQRNEAYLFLSQVKDASEQTWQDCLALFLERARDQNGVEQYRWGAQERMFAVQVVGER